MSVITWVSALLYALGINLIFVLIFEYGLSTQRLRQQSLAGIRAHFGNAFALCFFTGIIWSLTQSLFVGLTFSCGLYSILYLAHYLKLKHLALPLMPFDLHSTSTALRILPRLFNSAWTPLSHILIAAVILTFLVHNTVDWVKIPETPYLRVYVGLLSLASILSPTIVPYRLLRKAFQIAFGFIDYFWSPTYNCERNGFFLVNFLYLHQLKRRKPSTYSRAAVQKVLATPRQNFIENGSSKPTIIFYMIESYFDPLPYFPELTKDPIPFLRNQIKLKHAGQLRVPVWGGGTANSEFEALTGFPVHSFGAGTVYPYQSFLDRPIMALPSLLRKLHYRTCAIHPNEAQFWRRDRAYPFLGFDEFLDLASFKGARRDSKGYVTDDEVVSRVIKCLDANSGPNFIFATTIASHMPYSTTNNPGLARLYTPENLGMNQLEAYSRCLNESDQALQRLSDYVESSSNNTLLVAFGDHQPDLGQHLNSRIPIGKRNLTPLLFKLSPDLEPIQDVTNELPAYLLPSRVLQRSKLPMTPFFRFEASLDEAPMSSITREAFEIAVYDCFFGKRFQDEIDET